MLGSSVQITTKKNLNKSNMATRLRKRDRVRNALKSGVKTVGKGFQKAKPILQVIINPLNGALGFIFMTVMAPSPSMAMSLNDFRMPDVPGSQGNLTMIAILSIAVEESSYHANILMPGSEWFSQYIAAPIALGGTCLCSACSAICYSCGLHVNGWRFMSGNACCTSYLVGASRAHPANPIVVATAGVAVAARGSSLDP